MINFRILAIMGLMAVAAEINAQETTDSAEKRAKETVNKKQPNYPMKEVSSTMLPPASLLAVCRSRHLEMLAMLP